LNPEQIQIYAAMKYLVDKRPERYCIRVDKKNGFKMKFLEKKTEHLFEVMLVLDLTPYGNLREV